MPFYMHDTCLRTGGLQTVELGCEGNPVMTHLDHRNGNITEGRMLFRDARLHVMGAVWPGSHFINGLQSNSYENGYRLYLTKYV